MTSTIAFTLNGATVHGEKHAEAGNLSLVFIDPNYYVLKDGAVITYSWGGVRSYFKYSLPPFWKKKVKGQTPTVLSHEDALEVLKSFVEKIKQNVSCNVLSAGLFGSRARGDARIDSDYNVLLVIDKKFDPRKEDKGRDLFYDIASEFDEAHDMDILPGIRFVDDYERDVPNDTMKKDLILF